MTHGQTDPEDHEQRLIREGRVVSAPDYLALLAVNQRLSLLLTTSCTLSQRLHEGLKEYPTTPLPKYLKVPGLADTLAPPQRNIPKPPACDCAPGYNPMCPAHGNPVASQTCGLCDAGYPVDGGQHFAGGALYNCPDWTPPKDVDDMTPEELRVERRTDEFHNLTAGEPDLTTDPDPVNPSASG